MEKCCNMGKKRTVEKVFNQILELEYEGLMKQSVIANLLGYEDFDNASL